MYSSEYQSNTKIFPFNRDKIGTRFSSQIADVIEVCEEKKCVLSKLPHAYIAKNDKDSYRTIPNSLLPLLKAVDLSHPEWYVFSKHDNYDFTPGPVKVCSRKLAKYWSDHVREECGLPMDVQFYSLKDTGITNMLDSGVPINTVQKQADHSSVAMTAIYVGHKKTAAIGILTTALPRWAMD